MIIELVGLPGCGKTTLLKAMKKVGARAGLNFARPYNSDLEEYAPRGAPRYVRRRSARNLLYTGLKFGTDFPDLIRFLDSKFTQDDLKQKFLFVLNGALHQNARANSKNGPFLFDEGLVQRGLHLLDSNEDISAYLNLIPKSDLTIHLTLPPQIALQRCIDRRPEINDAREKIIHKFGDEDYFSQRADQARFAMTCLGNTGVSTLELDTTQSVGELAEIAVERVCSLRG